MHFVWGSNVNTFMDRKWTVLVTKFLQYSSFQEEEHGSPPFGCGPDLLIRF